MNSDINTRFILSLEDLEIRENQGKPGIIREFSMEIYPSQGEVRENKLFSLHIAFVNSCMVACKVVVRFVSVNLNFIYEHSALASLCRLISIRFHFRCLFF